MDIIGNVRLSLRTELKPSIVLTTWLFSNLSDYWSFYLSLGLPFKCAVAIACNSNAYTISWNTTTQTLSVRIATAYL